MAELRLNKVVEQETNYINMNLIKLKETNVNNGENYMLTKYYYDTIHLMNTEFDRI